VTEAISGIFDFLRLSLRDKEKWPRPLHLIQGALMVQSGQTVAGAALAVGATPSKLNEVLEADDIVNAVLKTRQSELDAEAIAKLRRNVAQLVLGRAAEIAFEEIVRAGIDPAEFELKDVREGRTNTDYRLLNGNKRPLYRFNVKFFGSVFRRGAEMVGLDPNDCFPLATYKIHAALQEQEREHLPYVFAVVGVPDLNAPAVATAIPDSEILPLSLLFASSVVKRKRDFQDWLVARIVEVRSPAFSTAFGRIRAAPWFILSARRADALLHQYLYARVYALRIPRFTRQFGGAEVDMHFSLSKDLVPLDEFLRVLRTDGQGKVTTMLERGTY
jgi:hypothetical protein